MNDITRVSDITPTDCADYMNLDSLTNDDSNLISNLIGVARAFIRSYTGLADDAIDTHIDFVVVVFILVQDMYDNRTLYVDTNTINLVVESILGMHSVNYL